MTRPSRRHDLVGLIAAGLIGFGIWGIFFWRASVSTHRSNNLCGVIVALVQQSKNRLGVKGTRDYEYYRTRPAALREDKAQADYLVRVLACPPVKLPPREES